MVSLEISKILSFEITVELLSPWYLLFVWAIRQKKKLLMLKLHGGLGDQLYMFFSATELAYSTSRRLVLCKWTIDRTHAGSPFGLLDLVSQDTPVEITQRPLNKISMDFHQWITGIVRGRISEKSFFRLKLHLDRLFGIINNVTSFSYELAEPGFIQRELRILKWRRRIQLDCYFPTISVYGSLNLKAMLPGLSRNPVTPSPAIVLSEGYAVAHFRVGDIFDTYTARGVLSPDYYESCIQMILETDPGIIIYGVSDNLDRAKLLYPEVPLLWINDSDKFDALAILRLLSSSRFLITANSGLSLWAGRLGSDIEKVYAPQFLERKDLLSNTHYRPFDENWKLVLNNFISQG